MKKNHAKSVRLLCFLLFVLTGLQLQAYDIRSGVLSYYPFDASTTADAAFTNNFTAVGAPVLVTTNPSPRGSVLQLSGSAQYLRLDHPQDHSVNGMPVYNAGTYSITMWVKSAGTATFRYLLAFGNSTSTTPFMAFQTGSAAANSNKLDVVLRNDANTTLLNHVVSSNNVFDGNWHHIAWVDNNGSVSFYIDGALDGNSPLFNYSRSGVFTFDRTALGTLIRTTVDTAHYFNGAIDDLSFWERPLNQSEVQQIMANGVAYPVPALPPAIFIEPVSQTKNFQDAVTFATVAQGTRPNIALTYQWNQNNLPILNATNRTYRIFNLTTANSGELYSVTVSNALGGVTSSNATLTVLADNAPNVRSNLVSYWPLDSITNNSGVYSTIDTYARNDFTLFNMSDLNVVGGHFGSALEFDNLGNTYALRSAGTPTFKTNGYSVSLWVYKPDGASAFQNDVRVFSESSTNTSNPLFTIGTTIAPTTSAKIYIRNDAGSALLDRASTRPVFDGNWHHLLWVDNNGLGKLYVDGVLDETDFTYTPSGTFSLNATSLGAVVRTTVGNGIFCDIDEVAAWSRALNYTEVQDVRDNGVPPPLAPTPPVITSQPVGTNVFTKASASFSVAVTGIGPFAYQWWHDTSPLVDQTNATLVLNNIQLIDAGAYKVVITNAGGSTNSQDAVLVVDQRPAPPAVLALDFNNRGQDAGNTEPGFDSFTLAGTGATTLQTTRLFGGVEVTADGSGITTIDSRLRATPSVNVDFTQSALLKDFIFSPPASGTDGLDVTIKFMQPNQQYAVTVWSYDSGQGTGDRNSDWYANGTLVKDDYTFNVSNPPTNNLRHQFSFYATTDADGQLVISGRRDSATAVTTVFLNALKVALPTAPDIDKQPAGADVFTDGDATFYVNAAGVGPFTYQWYKGAGQISGATDSVLRLNGVALSAADTYSVQIGNQIGTTNSAGAVLNVTPRPAAPATLAIDFNQRAEETGFTEDGFNSFVLIGTGGATALPTTRLFGGAEVTVSGSNGSSVDSRSRASITNSGAFTEEKLLRDFVYSTLTTNAEGLDIRVRFLAPNQPYNVTLWSFDDQQGSTNELGLVVLRTSDWYANGVLVKDNYSFYGTTTNEPTDNLQYRFNFTTTSDANGTILLQGRRDMTEAGISVFLNALKIALPQTVIGPVERVGGNLRLTIETPDSAQAHQLQTTGDLSNISWGPVSGVTTTVLGPTTLQMEFPAPTGATGFYRVVRTTP